MRLVVRFLFLGEVHIMEEVIVLGRKTRRPAASLIGSVLLCAAVLVLMSSPATGAGLDPGTPLPSFTGTSLVGEAVDSAAYRGKILLIDFWATTCSACLEEMPHLVDIYNRYRDQGLEALGINTDRSEKKVKRFIKKLPYEMTYANVIDAKAEIMRLLKVQMLPTTLLVDRAGVIRLYHVGYSKGYEKELEQEVKKLLAEP
jgi:peroxiredoxin